MFEVSFLTARRERIQCHAACKYIYNRGEYKCLVCLSPLNIDLRYSLVYAIKYAVLQLISNKSCRFTYEF